MENWNFSFLRVSYEWIEKEMMLNFKFIIDINLLILKLLWIIR